MILRAKEKEIQAFNVLNDIFQTIRYIYRGVSVSKLEKIRPSEEFKTADRVEEISEDMSITAHGHP